MKLTVILAVLIGTFVLACSSSAPAPNATAIPEPTSLPTATAIPEPTSLPTATALPEPTAVATSTPVPKPTHTPTPNALMLEVRAAAKLREEERRLEREEERRLEEEERRLEEEASDWLDQGVSSYRSGLYEDAIAYFDKAIEIAVKDNFYGWRGNSYQNLGQHEAAIQDYTIAIQFKPTATRYYNRGVSYNNLGQYQNAVNDYTNAIQLDPDYALAYNNRGVSYHALGEYEKARIDEVKACSLDSKLCASPSPLPTATPWTAKQLDSEFKTNPRSEPSVGFNCPKSVEPTYSVRLVNLSEIDDTAVTDCFNFAISHIANVDTETMLIMYPVGPYVGGEIIGNNTYYKGGAFTPVISKDQVDLIADQLEDYLTPACGSRAAEDAAWHLARFAELGGGQQVQVKGAGTGECSTKRWVVISIDPERAKVGRDLLFTFFHELFHTVQSGGNAPCTYSASEEDSFWLTEAGANYFAWEITAEVEGVDPTLIWYQWMNFISEREEWGLGLDDPGIAEKGAVALYLLRQRGAVNHADIINGSLFQGCSGHHDVFFFSKEAMRIARDYWSDYIVLDKSVVFSEQALNR